ncbi:MAG: DUF2269 domain-containing protein [Actinomycetota bacterium]|nr:DUF2269 domain-containing protein [Actinomycetota bacterium]
MAAVYQPDKLTFYDLVLFLHIASTIVAFGVVFAYPLFLRSARTGDPAHLPYFHRTQGYVGARLITGGATLVLITGIVMAASSDVYGFSDPFVSAGLLIVIVLLGLGGAVFAPLERRLAELATRDVAAAQGGAVQLSGEYRATMRRYDLAATFGATLVLAAVLLMVVKPL